MKNKRFTEIYESYRRLVMKIAYERVGDIYLAEEISQQVFTALYENLDKVRDESVKSWLIIATRTAIVDYFRKQKVRKEKLEQMYQKRAERTVWDNTERIVERVAQERLSFRILDDLRDVNREWYEIILAVCLYGLPIKEAAKYLRMSPQALSARLYRARNYIRRKYGEEYECEWGQ